MNNAAKYILITPAYNEEDCIAATIESVLAQTMLPYQWIIIDDGSTDGTADIIKKSSQKYDWIRYLHREKSEGQTYYSNSVHAIMEGYQAIQNEEFDYLAILDADITLPTDYYEQILEKFSKDNRLGIASGVYQDLVNGKLHKILNDRRSTPKAIQVFRKGCFGQIGGYLPLKYGGEDTCACIMARMNGWKSWSFPELCVVHNKPVGTGHSNNMLKIRFKNGINEYFLASHPLFVFLKSLRRCVKEPPYILGGFARLAGFLYGYFLREQRQVSAELVRFTRKEQIGRVFNFNRIKEDHAVNDHQNNPELKICFAASAGGHLLQLLKLHDICQGYDSFYVSTDSVVADKLKKLGKTYIVGECNRQHPVKTLMVMVKCLKIVLKERPSVVISTGAAPGYLLCIMAKILGAKVVWLDSIANTERLSMSGSMIRPFANLILSQWPDVAAKYKNVEYVGAII